jgi:glycosyltransferase involved in cell wall biosynthesis
MQPENPIVSIIVITYNSAEYVLETLESTKAQTYQNIELIVSDDCSKDHTVEICKDWLQKNHNRFVRTNLITFENNTGIASNCNRGFKAAQGEWVKEIAGDDILNPDCIESFLSYTKLYPQVFFFFSDIEIFGTGDFSVKRDSVRNWMNRSLDSFAILTTAESQYKRLKISNIVCSPSAFYHLISFRSLGGFDEEIKLLEDYPFWITATKNGYKILSIQEKLVKYRVNEYSVQTSAAYKIAYELFLQKYIFKNFLFRTFVPAIDQLNVKSKDKMLCLILKATSLPQRFIWKLKKKLRK